MARQRNQILNKVQSLKSDRKAELDSIIHVRKPLDVNKDILESNDTIDNVLHQVYGTLQERLDRSENRFEITTYEKQIKDNRFRDTSVNENNRLVTERMLENVSRCREI